MRFAIGIGVFALVAALSGHAGATSVSIDFDETSGSFASYTEGGYTFSACSRGTFRCEGGQTDLTSVVTANGTGGILSGAGPIQVMFDGSSLNRHKFSVDIGIIPGAVEPTTASFLYCDERNNCGGLGTFQSVTSSSGIVRLEALVPFLLYDKLSTASTITFTVVRSIPGPSPVVSAGPFYLDNFAVTPVPEPVSWAMMIGGLGMLGATARRRRRTSVRFG